MTEREGDGRVTDECGKALIGVARWPFLSIDSSHSIDPQGIDVGTPPQPRSVQIGITATL